MLRNIIECLSRNIVLKRRLPPIFGRRPLVVTPGSALRYWRRDLTTVDRILLEMVREHVQQGDVVWDIGANVGLFAFAAASIAGQSGTVLAVEPDAWLVSLLRRSAALSENSDLNLEILPVAVMGTVDIVQLNIAKRGRSANFVAGAHASSQTGGVRERHLIPAVTLDWLLDRFPAPRFLKTDVEGAEYGALKGGERLLSSVRPIILCEVAEECASDVTGIFRKHGYAIFNAEATKENRKPLERSVWNTLAYPN